MRAPLMTLLIALPFISMLWSIDPSVTVRRSVAVMFTSLAGVVIASRFKWATFLEVLATAFAIVVTLCFIYGALIPDLGRMKVEFPGAWQGVWGHKNTLGFNASIGFMIFASAAIANPRRWWLWAAFAVGALGSAIPVAVEDLAGVLRRRVRLHRHGGGGAAGTGERGAGHLHRRRRADRS